MNRPVIGLVSRLVDQKGLALIEQASDALVGLDAMFVFVGTGDAKHERLLRALAARHPSRVGVFIGFDEALAHLVEAGSDMFLMPSMFEPCGLNQMYSLRYGTVPIVRAVGGLDDTIRPYTSRAARANGFKFRRRRAPRSCGRFVRRCACIAIAQHGIASCVKAWPRITRGETSAREYVKVYRRARRDAAARTALVESGIGHN